VDGDGVQGYVAFLIQSYDCSRRGRRL